MIKRNYRTPVGEADAVMEKDGEIVFVEVKTRTGGAFGEPKDAVDERKKTKYYKIAQYYIAREGDKAVSFLVAEVTGDGVKFIEHAF